MNKTVSSLLYALTNSATIYGVNTFTFFYCLLRHFHSTTIAAVLIFVNVCWFFVKFLSAYKDRKRDMPGIGLSEVTLHQLYFFITASFITLISEKAFVVIFSATHFILLVSFVYNEKFVKNGKDVLPITLFTLFVKGKWYDLKYNIEARWRKRNMSILNRLKYEGAFPEQTADDFYGGSLLFEEVYDENILGKAEYNFDEPYVGDSLATWVGQDYALKYVLPVKKDITINRQHSAVNNMIKHFRNWFK